RDVRVLALRHLLVPGDARREGQDQERGGDLAVLDEEAGKVGTPGFAIVLRGHGSSVGITSMRSPSFTIEAPCVITRSPAGSPAVTVTRFPITSPSATGRSFARACALSPSTTMTAKWSRPPGAPTNAVSGSRETAPAGAAPPRSTEAIIPGFQRRSAFGSSTSTSKLRVIGSAAAAIRLTRATNLWAGSASVVTATSCPRETALIATSGTPITTLIRLTSASRNAGIPGEV